MHSCTNDMRWFCCCCFLFFGMKRFCKMEQIVWGLETEIHSGIWWWLEQAGIRQGSFCWEMLEWFFLLMFFSWLESTWNILPVQVPTWQGFLLFFLVELAAKVRLVLSSVNHRCRLWALQNWWSIHLHYNGKCMNMHGMFQWHFLRFEDGFVKFYVAAQEVAFCCSGHHFFVYIDPCLEGLRIIVELSGHVHCLSRYCHSPSAVLWWNETWFNEFAEFSEAIISFIEADQWILAIFEAWSECMDADGFFPRAAVGYSCCWQVQIGNAGHLPHLLTFSSCKSWPEGDYLIILDCFKIPWTVWSFRSSTFWRSLPLDKVFMHDQACCMFNVSWRWNSTFKTVYLRTLMVLIQMGDVFQHILTQGEGRNGI